VLPPYLKISSTTGNFRWRIPLSTSYPNPRGFGEIVAETRRRRGLTQKVLANQIRKKDGKALGLAYVNDIEHNRRNPPAPHFVAQLADVLGVPHDVLCFYARQLDEEVLSRHDDPSRERILAAYATFKRELRGET
jgi:transcriptional regulator with XRE-family HTH domain